MTSGRDDSLEISLRALRVNYAAALDAKLEEIEEALALARNGDGATAFATARGLVHRLRGTAGSYGFGGVSSAAAALEEALEPDGPDGFDGFDGFDGHGGAHDAWTRIDDAWSALRNEATCERDHALGGEPGGA